MAAIVLAVAPGGGMPYFHASRQWIELMPTMTPLAENASVQRGSFTVARCSSA
jgi:hypothetical protein